MIINNEQNATYTLASFTRKAAAERLQTDLAEWGIRSAVRLEEGVYTKTYHHAVCVSPANYKAAHRLYMNGRYPGNG